MELFHLTPGDYKTSAWAGGTTTEIFLWPQDGSYASRNFQVRISSARVDLPESDFTALPGVLRYITPLSGGFTLSHKDKAPVVLGPLDPPYRFDGGIDTHCVGTATDFNLMLKGVSGEMTVEVGAVALLPGFSGIYAPEALEVTLDGRVCRLAAGEFLGIFCEEAHPAFLSGPAIFCHANL